MRCRTKSHDTPAMSAANIATSRRSTRPLVTNAAVCFCKCIKRWMLVPCQTECQNPFVARADRQSVCTH